MKKTFISLSAAALFGSGMAHAAYTPTVTTTGNNFTMTSATGGLTGGTNDVVFTWDGTYRTAVVTDGSYNATLSSLSPFSGKIWTAHHVNIYGPGTYTFNAAGVAGDPSGTSSTMYTMTVGAGQVGAHMLFDWSTSTNIDVVNVWDMNKSWAQTGTTSPFKTGGCSATQTPLVLQCADAVLKNTADTVWGGVSIDTDMDPDNYTGTKMIDGPFVGQSGNFNVNGIVADPSGWFSFTPLSGAGVTAGSTQTSNTITVAGIGTGKSISISGGSYSISGGAYTSASGTVSDGNTVTVQHSASTTPGGTTTTDLTINGITKSFVSTTFLPDITPDVFSFSSQAGVSLSSLVVSDTITLTGINSAAPISVSNGEYSIDGGAYTSTSGTITNNQTVTVRHTSASSNVSAVSTVLDIGGVTGTFTTTTKAANSVPFSAAFTMLDSAGSLVGRDTEVTGTYDDSNINTSSTGTSFNMTLQSSVPFFGKPWVAHDIRVFGPGTYTVNSDCTVAEIRATGGATCAASGPSLTFTVNPGQLGAHILFDWSGNNDIDVALVWNTDSSASAVPASKGIVYKFSSQDGNGDGIAGFPMVAGPFIGFNANFDIKFANYTVLTASQEGYPISGWTEVASSALASGMPANFTAGSGGVQFVVTLPSGQTTATIVLDAPNLKANDKAYWVDGSGVYHEITSAIYDFTAKTVTYTVTDGGFGDTDTVTGTISDPVIILSPVPQVASSSGSGGGGCTIGRSAFDPVLPGSVLAALSWLGWRRRKGE